MTTTYIYKKIVINFLILIFGLFCNNVIGQNLSSDNKSLYKSISYGEKINFGSVENSSSWSINFLPENKIINLTANQINEYVFDKPGQYIINFSENKIHKHGDCNHDAFPENMVIEVSASKMIFDFSKINFSNNFQVGNNDDIIISVPVSIATKENKITKSTIANLTIAGLGCNLVALPLQKEIKLENGTQIIKFSVSGTIANETYLMFDFEDNNKNIQTYNLLQKIN